MKEKRLVFRGKGPEGGASSNKVESNDPVTAFADRMISGQYEKELRAKGDAMRAEKRAEALRQKQADMASAEALMTELKLAPNNDEDFDKVLGNLDAQADTTSADDLLDELGLQPNGEKDLSALLDDLDVNTKEKADERLADNDTE